MNTENNNDQALKSVKNKNGAGRKGNYEYLVAPRLKEVEDWAKIGVTEAVIARKLGISVRSLNTYKKQHKQFLQAIKRGREDLIIDVKLSMAQSAKGFYYKETTEPDKIKVFSPEFISDIRSTVSLKSDCNLPFKFL